MDRSMARWATAGLGEMKRLTVILAICALATGLLAPGAHAGGLFGGALGGAVLGNMVGGRKAARKGAIIGGVIGAAKAINESSRHQENQKQREESRRRAAQWEAEQQAEEARIERARAASAPSLATRQTLVIETQKSLIRMGYDPGNLGEAGPALTEAVTRYQDDKGLLTTGELSQPLLTHMLRNGG